MMLSSALPLRQGKQLKLNQTPGLFVCVFMRAPNVRLFFAEHISKCIKLCHDGDR